MKWITTQEASVLLETSPASIQVTACNYKKQHGQHPDWYKSSGINQKAYIDIDYLLNVYNRERTLLSESVELYYIINEKIKIKDLPLAKILASKSDIYNKFSSWNAFLRTALFGNPNLKFHDRVTRAAEFHRIASKIVEEYNA